MLDPSEKAALKRKQGLLYNTGHFPMHGEGKRGRALEAVGIALMVILLAVGAAVVTWLVA